MDSNSVNRFLTRSLITTIITSSYAFTTTGRNIHFDPNNILPSNYVKEYRPQPPHGGPVTVNFTIFIHDVSTINAINMDFRIDMYLTQTWQDWRLMIQNDTLEEGEEFLVLPSSFLKRMWQPHPYISNAKSSSILSLTEQSSSILIFYNKTVKFNIRMSVTLGCQLEFRQFPSDVQECSMTLESFTYDDKKVRFQWTREMDSVIMNPELKLLQFHLEYPIPTENLSIVYADRPGQFSQLRAVFRFERYLGYHLIQVFFPSFLIVALSWFSFYMGLDAVPGRSTVLVTTFLSLITMFGGMRADLPAISYVKAIDIWMATCMLFLFSATAEFITVKYLDYMNKTNTVAPEPTISERLFYLDNRLCKWPPTGVFINKQNHQAWSEQVSFKKFSPRQHMNELAQRQKLILTIEWYSRILFPLAFAVFTIVYCPLLLYRKI